MPEQKQLFKSHQELIRLKMDRVNSVQAELQATINLVAVELGIDPSETWKLMPDLTVFEKIEAQAEKK